MQHGLVRVQHGLVVSVLGCCTAAPGSNPTRHPTLGPAGRKLFAQMQELLTQLRKKEYPAGEHPECNAGIGEVKTKTNNTGLETEITVQVLNKFVVTV